MKINRTYELLITLDDGSQLKIEPPLTIDFTIVRTMDSSLNTMNLNITNLSLKTRNQFFKEKTNIGVYRRIVLKAGYNNKLRTIFVGNILESYSNRQNANIITNVFCQDGGFALQNSYSNFTVKSDEGVLDGVKKLIKDLVNVEGGILGEFLKDKKHKRGTVYDGKTFQLLQRETGNKVFIDLEKLNVLDDNEVIEGSLPLINSQTGLLGTPRRRGNYLEVETIFSPEITTGQLIKVESSVNPLFDGQYKVAGITHVATISGAVSGEARTILQLYIGTQLLGGLKVVG